MSGNDRFTSGRRLVRPHAASPTAEQDPERRRQGGRPRDERAHQLILDATLELLWQVGYSAMTIEGVAAHAGVGKTTIYRRWPSKGALVVEAISGPICPIATGKWTVHLGPLPDTGSLRGDLLTFVERVNYAFNAPLASRTLPGLAADLATDTELAKAYRKAVVKPKQLRIAEVLQRAKARGELHAAADVELLCDLLVGPLLYRALLTGERVDQSAAEALVDNVLRGIGLPTGESPRLAEAGVR
jgi:AcrR family transcriptional regulator